MRADIMDAPARLKEKRLTERVRQKWAQIAQNRLPSLREMEALNFGDDKGFLFAVDLRLSDIFPYFVFMGDKLESYSSLYHADARGEKTLLDSAMSKMDEAALNREPVEFSEVKRLQTGQRIAFRSILLPLAENGTDVSHIFGAANGKLL
ncbi:MAG: hypothetical protein R3C58_03305 [Parvularculaceae bacterium]